MNVNLVYKTAYNDSEPFSNKENSIYDLFFASVLVGIIDELSEKKNEISFLGLYLTYLKNAGLDLNDLQYSFDYFKNIENKRDYTVDRTLYINFCENKLFENINKSKKLLPYIFNDLLPKEPKNISEENISYSQFILSFANCEDLSTVLFENKKDKNFKLTKKGKVLEKFVSSFTSLSNPQQDYLSLVKKIVQETKLTPNNVYKTMEDLLDSCVSGKAEFAKRNYKNTPKFKQANKKTLSNGVEVKSESSENYEWEKITELPNMVIGQDEALNKVMEKIMGSYVGFGSDKEPVATFLLTGPTGVGKTETAKAVAELIFDNNLFVVDMTTFKSDIDISRLLGGSPNYVGYGDPNAFCDFVQEHPQCVVLFDEIDKASKGCLDLLMRIIDEGEFINAKGNVVSMRDTIIICTTNLTEYVNDKESAVEEKITNADGLRKEIVGRFSEVIEYKPLTKEACKQIAKKFFLTKNIENFESKNLNKNLKIEYDEALLDKIVECANYKLLGARDLKKSIQTHFISPVTKYILKNKPTNTTLCVGINGVKNNSSMQETTSTSEMCK